MREIKFRAWHNKGKAMIDWEMMMDPEYNENINRFLYDNFREDGLDVELMQYTGLKDKNDKEIYESDVIKSERTKLYYVIKMDEAAARWVAVCTDKEKDYCLGTHGWNEAEIIGNIYENPELIKK